MRELITRTALPAAALLGACGLVNAQSALVWENEAFGAVTNIAEDACLSLGLATTVINGNLQGDFRSQLATGQWDVVVVNNPLNLFEADTIAAMEDYVANGGRLHASYWNADDLLTGGLFGYTAAADYFIPKNKVDIGDPSWGGVGNLSADLSDPVYDDNGDDLTLAPGYRAGLENAGGTIATSVGPQTIFNAWDYFSMASQASTQRGIEAQIRYLLGMGSGNLVYTSARQGARWELDAADAAFGPGRYRLILVDQSELVQALDSGRYGCVVIHEPAVGLRPETIQAIEDAVDRGDKVHLSYWNLDASAALQSAFRVAGTVDFFAPMPVYNNAGHPSWSVVAGPVTTGADMWHDNGDELTAAAMASVVSTFNSTAGPGATVVATTGQRTLINGFEYESMNAAEVADLLEAQIIWLCNAGCIQFEDLSAGQAVPLQPPGVRFSTTGGGPASVSSYLAYFGTKSVVNATAGGSAGDRRLTLRMDMARPIQALEMDFHSAGDPGANFAMRFYESGALVRTESLAPTGSSWRRDLRFTGLGQVTRVEIDSTDPTWLFSVDNVCVRFACRADFDGDGQLTLFDFLAFQNAFAAGLPSADFDGDGQLTLFDFLAFQNEFAAGCP